VVDVERRPGHRQGERERRNRGPDQEDAPCARGLLLRAPVVDELRHQLAEEPLLRRVVFQETEDGAEALPGPGREPHHLCLDARPVQEPGREGALDADGVDPGNFE